MSKLNPAPGVLTLGGIERHLYFDYAAIERIQDIYDDHPFAAIKGIFAQDAEGNSYYRAKNLIDLADILVNNQPARERALEGHTDLKPLDRETIAHMIDRDNADAVVAAILSAWTGQTPQGDEPQGDEDDEDDGGDDPDQSP